MNPGAPPLPPGRAIELPGRGTTFVRELPGPPGAPTLVLLHGLSATADLNWFPSFGPLGRHHRVVALDQRGHGRGIRSRRRFRLSDCADDVAALVDVLDLGRVVPVGYSMGGPVAQLMWHRHRERVEGLVLCATSRNFRGHPREQAAFALLPGLSVAARIAPASVRRSVTGRVLAGQGDGGPLQQWAVNELRQNDPAVLMEAAASLGRFSSHPWIGEVDVPTAVVITERDTLVPPHRQRRLAESIPGATIHPVAADHGACVMRPDRFTPVLLAACRSVTARARAGAGR